MHQKTVVKVLTWILVLIGSSWALSSSGRNVCSRTRSVSYSQPYTTYTSCGPFGWRRCARGRHRTAYKFDVSYFCCANWVSVDGVHCDKAICFGLPAGSCPNGGTCRSPGVCSCPQGYSPPNCIDTDECAISNGGCEDVCVNTEGSYQCECTAADHGLHEDGLSCKPICLGYPPGLCPNGGECIEPDVCHCASGFESANCTDIDECSTGMSICDHQCVNTHGSYLCDCNEGYGLATDNRTCLPVCGDSPPGTCPNGGSCVAPGNCTCPVGYQPPRCQDVDECQDSNGGCEEICVNSLGSYQCDCPSGFGIVHNTSCSPVCHGLAPGKCPNGGTCRNPDTCECEPGFTGDECSDINECLVENGGCQQECHNTNGSFTCDCFAGFALLPGGTACRDVDECEVKNGGCAQTCENSVGFYNCTCKAGFLLDTDERDCADIDECVQNAGHCQHECVNIPGSFACTCPDGFSLGIDGTSCKDKDECSVNNGGCDQTCENNNGSFLCVCQSGYGLGADGRSCEDIDECSVSSGKCSDLCINDPGTYHCGCSVGYRLMTDGVSCQDVDECEVSNGGCEEFCNNTDGSWKCFCGEGFLLAPDGLTCQDASKCPFNGNINCWPLCTPLDDGVCKCPNATVIHTDGSHCIDPCYSSPCRNGGQCQVTNTSFQCGCEGTGYTGEFCHQGVVSFPNVVTVYVNDMSDTYQFHASPKRQLVLHAETDRNTQLFPNPLVITHPARSASFQVRSKTRGLHLVTWRADGPDSPHYTEIPPLKVATEDVFTRLGLVGDVLPRGCYRANIPFGEQKISFFSTHPWYTMSSKGHFTEGVVFLEINNYSLPVSDSGLEAFVVSEKMLFGRANMRRQIKNGALVDRADPPSCHEVSLSEQDHKDFVERGSFFKTFFGELENILPRWLAISPKLLKTGFKSQVVSGRDVQRMPNCHGAPVFDSKHYFVVKVSGELILTIAGESVNMSSSTDASWEFCFILGIQGDWTFILMLPEEASTALQNTSVFRIFKDYDIQPVGIGVSPSMGINVKHRLPSLTFWNGDELFNYGVDNTATVWFGLRRKQEIMGNVMLSRQDIEKAFTHLFSDSWTATLRFDKSFRHAFRIPVLQEVVQIELSGMVEYDVTANALVSFGGEGRTYCGAQARPPGIFAKVSVVKGNLLIFQPIITSFDIGFEAYLTFVLDTSYVKKFMTLIEKQTRTLSGYKSDIDNLTNSNLGQEAARLITRLQSITESALKFVKDAVVRTVKNAAEFLFSLQYVLFDLRHAVNYLIGKLSLDVIALPQLLPLRAMSDLLSRIEETARRLQHEASMMFESAIDIFESFGFKGHFSISLLGMRLSLGGELVWASKHLRRCDQFLDIYKDLDGEEAFRMLAYAEAEVFLEEVTSRLWKFLSVPVGAKIGFIGAQHSKKFAFQIGARTNLLGIKTDADLFLKHNGLSFLIKADVWNWFTAQIAASANVLAPLSRQKLNLKGSFLAGSKSFQGSFGEAVRKRTKTFSESASKRLEQVQKELQSSKQAVTDAQDWLEEKKRVLDDARRAFEYLVNRLEQAKETLEAAEGPFRTAKKAVIDAKRKVDSLCKIQRCSSHCIPGIAIESCSQSVWLFSIPWICVKTVGCMFTVPDLLCETRNVGCRLVRGLAYAALTVAEAALSIPLRALDLAQAAVSLAQIAVDKSQVVVDVAEGAVDLASSSLELVKVSLDAATAAVELVKEAVKIGAQIVDFILKIGFEYIIDVRSCGFELELSTRDLFEFDIFCEVNPFSLGWRRVGFTVNFNNIAASLWNAAKGLIDSATDGLEEILGRRKREVEFTLYSNMHKVYRQRRETNTTGTSNESNFSVNETIQLPVWDVKEFWAKQCFTYQPVFHFLLQGIDILRNITADMTSKAEEVLQTTHQPMFETMTNVTADLAGVNLDVAALEFNLTVGDIEDILNQASPEDDEVIRESKASAEFMSNQSRRSAESVLKYKIIPLWKAQMENVTRNTFSSKICSGFHDCVVYTFGEFYQLLDSVDLKLVSVSRMNLPDLERAFFELLDNDTRGVADVKNITEDMLMDINLIDVADIFCGTAPEITEAPANTTALKGSHISLKCAAVSVPAPTYYWYKNDDLFFLGDNLTTIEIYNVSSKHEGVYKCMAGNHIDNTTAEDARLSMVYPAEITSHLEKSLEILSGATVVMSCSSAGKPQPVTSWFSTSDAPHKNGNASSDLTLTNVSASVAGLYACEASNMYGKDLSSESVLHVFNGKPLCPRIKVVLGYLASTQKTSITILEEAGRQVSDLKEGMELSLSMMVKGIKISVLQTNSDVISMFITSSCDSNGVCTEATCPIRYQSMLEKVRKSWIHLQTKFDPEKALFTLSDHTYYVNPSIVDEAGVESKCPPGYRQFMDYACVNDDERYILPAPAIKDVPQTDLSYVLSWKVDPLVERFVKGYRVILRAKEDPVILNATTVQSSYDLSLHVSQGDESVRYEIWVRAFTAFHHSQWARKVIGTDTHSDRDDAATISGLALGLGLGIGLPVVLCLMILTTAVLYRRVLRPKYGSFSFSIVQKAVGRATSRVRRVTRAENPET